MATYKINEIIINMLEIINSTPHSEDSILQILSLFKKLTGFEAIGIRLREGFDYPYYVSAGFPEYFVKAENFLCSYDEDGTLLKDSHGNPILECMCGNVICKRFDPALPFFTKQGSFWSNCTSKLLASTSEEERQARTRNRCNSEGYESVALIPLKAKNENIGLLQFNDSRKDMFTKKMILDFEKIGEAIGIAYSQKTIEEELKTKSNKLNNRIRELYFLNIFSEITDRNDKFENIFEIIAQTIPNLWGKNIQYNILLSMFNKNYFSDNFTEGTLLYKSPVKLKDNEIGSLSIYTSEPVLDDEVSITAGEQAVIKIVLNRISKMVELKMAGEALKKSHNELEAKVKERTGELNRITRELQKSLQGKDILLKEVYHRTKNNLCVITHLLALQISTTKNKQVQKHLQDSYNRIMAMQSLHEMFYKSDDFINIDISNYIPILAKNLIENYQTTRHPVQLKTDIEKIKLPATIVTPLALILNEIICNSLKYAFHDKENGCIYITAALDDDNVLIIIKDNGIGFKNKNIIPKSKTLGIQLIQTLAKQIKGSVEINSKNGVEYKIKFKNNNKNNSIEKN